MNRNEYVAFLEKQIEHLGREKELALQALELASSLGNFETSYTSARSAQPMLEEMVKRAHGMIEFKCVAVYLVNEDDFDFVQVFCDDPDMKDWIEEQVDGLIQDQSFSWSLEKNQATFFLASDKSSHLLLHPLATPSRTRGMFIGVLKHDKKDISDVTLSLMTVVMLACAHALESIEFYRKLDVVRGSLEVKAERRAKELERVLEQQNAIINSVQAGVLLIDYAKKTIVDVNPAALTILRAKREHIIGRKCYEIVCPAEKDKCPITDFGKEVDNSEVTILTLDGNELSVMKSVVKVVIQGKRYLLESFIDVSEQKKLGMLKEEVDRIMRHDLKSPLNGIIGIPDLLLSYDNLDDEQKEFIQLIKDSGYRMLNMINLSHDLYKMETGNYDLAPVSVSIPSIVNNIYDELKPCFISWNISFNVVINSRKSDGDNDFIAWGEPLLYYSLLANLVKNAVEASPKNSEITVSLDNSDMTRISIHNQGEIPEAIRDRFFDKYVTHGKAKGTGLGTYSARLISNTLGGDISFETSEKEGTTIIVELPLPDHLREAVG